MHNRQNLTAEQERFIRFATQAINKIFTVIITAPSDEEDHRKGLELLKKT